MIEIIPAIDLFWGRCVRLSQGDFARETRYPESPEEMAARFLEAGLRRIHVVDLEGAKAGRPMNLPVLERLAAIGGLDMEWGGGLKTESDLETVLEAGAGHVILGTVAVREPDFFRRALDRFGPERIILGADVRGTEVATHGWQQDSGMDITDLISSFLPALSEVIVTQIARDGMLGGADVALYRRLQDRFPGVTFTASGGIGSVADIRALESAGIPRVIVGKALYEHKIRLEELWSPNA